VALHKVRHWFISKADFLKLAQSKY